MKLLAVDAATAACSAALAVGEQTTARFAIAPRAHDRLLFEQCDALLDDAGLDWARLDAVAFGRGPGALTGVRVAAALAQGVAWPRGLPAVAVSDLAMVAQAAADKHDASQVLATLDARMGGVYYGYFARGDDGWVRREGAEGVAAPDAVPGLDAFEGAVAGSGLQAHPSLGRGRADDPDILPAAEWALRFARRALAAGGGDDDARIVPAHEALPVYLREQF